MTYSTIFILHDERTGDYIVDGSGGREKSQEPPASGPESDHGGRRADNEMRIGRKVQTQVLRHKRQRTRRTKEDGKGKSGTISIHGSYT